VTRLEIYCVQSSDLFASRRLLHFLRGPLIPHLPRCRLGLLWHLNAFKGLSMSRLWALACSTNLSGLIICVHIHSYMHRSYACVFLCIAWGLQIGWCWLCLVTLTLEWEMHLYALRVLCSPAPCIIAFGCGDHLIAIVLLCVGLVCMLGIVLYIHRWVLSVYSSNAFVLFYSTILAIRLCDAFFRSEFDCVQSSMTVWCMLSEWVRLRAIFYDWFLPYQPPWKYWIIVTYCSARL